MISLPIENITYITVKTSILKNFCTTFTILFFCLSRVSHAQFPQFSFKTLSVNQGLSQSSVVDISFDDKGFVWLATQDGLNRYDGKDFMLLDKSFDDKTLLTSSRLGKIVPGGNHKLWLITEGGNLEKLDLLNYSFQLIFLSVDGKKIPSKLNCVYEDGHGKLLIGTESDGLIVYDIASNKIIKQIKGPDISKSNNEAINAVYEDHHQNLWIIGSTNVMSLQGDILIAHPVLNMFGQIQKEAGNFSCIDEDKEGNVWLGTYGQGLYRRQKGDTLFKHFTAYETSGILPDLIIETILADDTGRIWIGTYGKGLFIIDQKLRQIHNLKNDKNDPSSVSYNDILSIKKDKNNGIWLGTDGGGVSYYNERINNFTSFTNSNLPNNIEIAQIRSVVTDKAGQIWAGTSSTGLTLLNKNKEKDSTFKFQSYKGSSPNVNRIVSLLVDPEGDLWVGTQGNGLLLFDMNKKKLIRHFYPQSKSFNISDHTIWCIYPKSKTEVWAGTQNAGLCLIDKVKGLVKNYAYKLNGPNSIRDNNVRTITPIDNSTLCLGYEKKGIEFFDTQKEVFLPFKIDSSSNFFKTEPTIKCVFYSKPILWIGTQSKGLFAINRFTGQVTHLTEKNGLPNNTVYGILQDGHANLWISTNKGISRFVLSPNQNSLTTSGFINYTAADGLQNNEFNTGAYYKGQDGTLYFGGISGLTMFNPDKFTGRPQSTNVVFTNISINNEPLPGDTLPAYKHTLTLSYKANSIAFNFAALDYPLSHQQRYYYFLEGYDKAWVEAGKRNYAAYTNLPPGHYLFKVKASRYKSSESDTISYLTIIITPPFYITWWFVTLSIVAGLLLLYAIYRYRILQLLEVQKVRNNIAADLHDDIGSSLTNISILSELTKQNLLQSTGAKDFLERIIEEVSSSSQALDDIIWSVNAKDNTLEDLLARMRRYAAELFDAGKVTYELGFDEQLSDLKLQMEQRRDLYLIFKEAMNNISKHAAASHVKVYIKGEDHKLLLLIKDNGKGFDTGKETHRNGLKNIEARSKKWKGTVFIESAQGKGTAVQVWLPVK